MIKLLIIAGILLIIYEFSQEVGKYSEDINPYKSDCYGCMGPSYDPRDCEDCPKLKEKEDE